MKLKKLLKVYLPDKIIINVYNHEQDDCLSFSKSIYIYIDGDMWEDGKLPDKYDIEGYSYDVIPKEIKNLKVVRLDLDENPGMLTIDVYKEVYWD